MELSLHPVHCLSWRRLGVCILFFILFLVLNGSAAQAAQRESVFKQDSTDTYVPLQERAFLRTGVFPNPYSSRAPNVYLALLMPFATACALTGAALLAGIPRRIQKLLSFYPVPDSFRVVSSSIQHVRHMSIQKKSLVL